MPLICINKPKTLVSKTWEKHKIYTKYNVKNVKKIEEKILNLFFLDLVFSEKNPNFKERKTKQNKNSWLDAPSIPFFIKTIKLYAFKRATNHFYSVKNPISRQKKSDP